MESCPRCHGLLLPEIVHDLSMYFVAMVYCVNCGYRHDPHIQLNRTGQTSHADTPA